MGDFGLRKIEKVRLEQRKGLTGRGLFGCASFLISAGLAYFLYQWLSQHYDLRRMFSVPYNVSPVVVQVAGTVILLVIIQFVMTLATSVFWKLGGRDKKVDDKMDDLLKQWDKM